MNRMIVSSFFNGKLKMESGKLLNSALPHETLESHPVLDTGSHKLRIGMLTYAMADQVRYDRKYCHCKVFTIVLRCL